MTRIVVLDESQATVVGEAITILLKELGKEKAAIEFAVSSDLQTEGRWGEHALRC